MIIVYIVVFLIAQWQCTFFQASKVNSINAELIEDDGEHHYKVLNTIGGENGLGVENLTCASVIAGWNVKGVWWHYHNFISYVSSDRYRRVPRAFRPESDSDRIIAHHPYGCRNTEQTTRLWSLHIEKSTGWRSDYVRHWSLARNGSWRSWRLLYNAAMAFIHASLQRGRIAHNWKHRPIRPRCGIYANEGAVRPAMLAHRT